jgi:hypothetical protein
MWRLLVADEYIDFQEAMRELKLEASQLKRLVSEGGVSASRNPQDPANMRFRKDEIDRLKRERAAGETKDLKEDLVFDESQGLDIADEGMATAQINAGATQVGNSGKTAVPATPAKPSPRLSSTRSAAKPSTRSAASAPAATTSTRRSSGSAAPVAADDGSGVGAGMVATLALSALVCLFAAMVWWDIANNHVSGATKGISNWALQTFTTPK